MQAKNKPPKLPGEASAVSVSLDTPADENFVCTNYQKRYMPLLKTKN